MHLVAGHEATGQHAQTLDLEIRDFLEEILNRPEEIAIILEGDHGMRYGEWWSTEEAAVEWRLPAFFFIASDNLLEKVPNSVQTLVHNTHRLTSKIHQRYMTLFLAELATGVNFNSTNNLLTTKTSDSLSCSDLGIDTWLCSCRSFELLNDIVIDRQDLAEMKQLVNEIVIETMYFLNMQVQMSFRLLKICKELKLKEILQIWGLPIDATREMLKIHLLTEGNAKFEVVYLLKNRKRATRPGSFRTDQIAYRNYKRGSQLLFVNRLDRYEGPCESLAVKYHAPAKLCLCNEEFL